MELALINQAKVLENKKRKTKIPIRIQFIRTINHTLQSEEFNKIREKKSIGRPKRAKQSFQYECSVSRSCAKEGDVPELLKKELKIAIYLFTLLKEVNIIHPDDESTS